MKREQRALVLGAIAALGILAIVWAPGKLRNDRPTSSSLDSKPEVPKSKFPPAAPSSPASEHSTLADNLNSPATDIRSDLRIVAEIIDAFRSNFPQTGNPVGNNREITAALTGKNQLHLAFIAPDHSAINSAGELCDRWGTPFFFHAESGTHMEIRSAGPDKKMWNADDVVRSP